MAEEPSSLVNPTLKINEGSLKITGEIKSDHYVWYAGGDDVRVYDLNWNKLEDLPVTLKNAEAASGEAEISVTNHNKNGNPWLECQFFVKDTPMKVLSK